MKKGKPLLAPGQAIRNRCLLTYTSNAQRRGIVWSLSDAEFNTLIKGSCHYCGEPPSRLMTYKGVTGSLTYNGIDRTDNTFGYVSGNVVSCCALCNRCKSNLPYKQFVAYLRRAGEHLNG